MAQVMKYHEYPNDYNWDNMPNTEGTTSTSILMRDIGDAVDMDFGCYGSGAEGNTIAPALKNNFDYSSYVSYSDYDGQKVVSDLSKERPVILLGDDGSSIGHAWVCDGSRTYHNECTGNQFLDLYMNWGWDGDYNGWYDYNNFDPGGNNYNHNKKMVHKIIP